MSLSRRQRPSSINIWPGFVDALTQLTMVLVFVLLIFTIGQFYLSGAVSDQDKEIRKLTATLSALDSMLALEKREDARLRSNVDALRAALAEADASKAKLADTLVATENHAAATQGDLATARSQLQAQDATIAGLNRNIDELRRQLTAIAAALDLAQTKSKAQDVQLADLGAKLNLALARKVEDLARYRSEFFGRLKEILGDRPGIRVVGDRFVFQSEVLFALGSADLSPEARKRLAPLVAPLRQISSEIPASINWILEVDGHTDNRPIVKGARYASNWELSTARAVSVVDYLVSQGIPARHLAAAGFGQWQPLDARDNDAAFEKNRRIELRLTQH
jgi:chemotaxis protein MotB